MVEIVGGRPQESPEPLHLIIDAVSRPSYPLFPAAILATTELASPASITIKVFAMLFAPPQSTK